MRSTGLMTLAALPIAFSLVLGAGPRDARAAPEKPRFSLCGLQTKPKACVNSLDVKDSSLNAGKKRIDEAKFGFHAGDPVPNLGSVPRIYAKASMKLSSPGVVIVVASAEIESRGSNGGSVLCVILPGKTAVNRDPHAFLGSVDEKVKFASMYATAGFEVTDEKFKARLQCALVGGSTVSLETAIQLHYVAKRYGK